MADKSIKRLARMFADFSRRLDTRNAAQLPLSSVGLDDGSSRPVQDGIADAADAVERAWVIDAGVSEWGDVAGDAVVNDTFLPEQFVVGDAADISTQETAIHVWERTNALNTAVTDAQADAAQAVQDAADALTTISGKNARRHSVTEPEPPPTGWEQGDQWVREELRDGVLVPVQVLVWNGTEFVPELLLADGLIIPGSVGNILLKDGVVTAEKFAATAFDGIRITGSLIRTAEDGQRLELSEDGFRAYNSSGSVTGTINPGSGGFHLVGNGMTIANAASSATKRTVIEPGRVQVGPEGLYSASLVPATGLALRKSKDSTPEESSFNVDLQPDSLSMLRTYKRDSQNWTNLFKVSTSSNLPSVTFGIEREGSTAASAGIRTTLPPETIMYADTGEFSRILGWDGLSLQGDITKLQLGSDGTGRRVWSQAVYDRTYSGAANMYITNQGTFGRSTSARRYKQDEQVIDTDDYADKLLSIPFKSWIDKKEATLRDEHAAFRNENPMCPTPPQFAEAHDTIPRHVGAVAEDFVDAGLPEFVTFTPDGEPDGLQYDRVGVALLPIIAELREQLSTVQARLAAAEATIEQMQAEQAL